MKTHTADDVERLADHLEVKFEPWPEGRSALMWRDGQLTALEGFPGLTADDNLSIIEEAYLMATSRQRQPLIQGKSRSTTALSVGAKPVQGRHFRVRKHEGMSNDTDHAGRKDLPHARGWTPNVY